MPDGAKDDRFQQLVAQRGLWSCCGYDILSLAFDLPLDAVRSLSEGQKRALVRLLRRLAESGEGSLRTEVSRLDSLSSEARLAALTQLSAPFLP